MPARVVDAKSVAQALGGAERHAGGWKARCPAHDDRKASLNLSDAQDGRLLVHCHAGCEQSAVIDALKQRDLWPGGSSDASERPRSREIVATYDYCDGAGTLVFQVVRFRPKDFRQRRPNGHGGWTWGLKGVEPIPYRLPELQAAEPDATVFIVEGEKDADRLTSLGLVATTAAMGAKKWRDQLNRHFIGRRVVVLPDNDDPGRAHAHDIASRVVSVAASVRVLNLAGLPDKGDVSDWLDAGGTAESLLAEAERCQEFRWASDGIPSVSSVALEGIVDPVQWLGKAVPERKWVVPGWIPWGAVTSLYGDGGVGKSLLSQQLLTAIATGGDWLGKPVTSCKALGFFCEDDADELHRRQVSINDAYGIGHEDLERLRFLPRVTEDNFLVTFSGDEPRLTDLYHALVAYCRAEGIQFVVVDTAADTFGGNEVVRIQANYYLKAVLGRLAREIDGSVVLLAHPSLTGRNAGGGLSGSTAWNAAVRSRLYLTRPEDDDDGPSDPDLRVLSREKANYAQEGDELRLRWRDGVLVTDAETRGVVAAIEKRTAEDVFVEGLVAMEAQGRPASESKNAANYAPRAIAKLSIAKGFKIRDMERAMSRLFDAGRIRAETYGQGGRSRKIVVVDGVHTQC